MHVQELAPSTSTSTARGGPRSKWPSKAAVILLLTYYSMIDCKAWRGRYSIISVVAKSKGRFPSILAKDTSATTCSGWSLTRARIIQQDETETERHKSKITRTGYGTGKDRIRSRRIEWLAGPGSGSGRPVGSGTRQAGEDLARPPLPLDPLPSPAAGSPSAEGGAGKAPWMASGCLTRGSPLDGDAYPLHVFFGLCAVLRDIVFFFWLVGWLICMHGPRRRRRPSIWFISFCARASCSLPWPP